MLVLSARANSHVDVGNPSSIVRHPNKVTSLVEVGTSGLLPSWAHTPRRRFSDILLCKRSGVFAQKNNDLRVFGATSVIYEIFSYLTRGRCSINMCKSLFFVHYA